MKLFCSAGIITLRQVVDLCGPNLTEAKSLASHVGISSIRVINQLLNSWKCELTKTELSLLNDYYNKSCQPMFDDPFPELILVPDFKDCTGQLLEYIIVHISLLEYIKCLLKF